MGNHIYGIIAASEEIDFGPLGISGKDDVVFTIPYQDIAALASSSPSLAYESVPKETLVRYLARHQAVIEGVMRSYTVIPMKFGTVARDKEELDEILARGYTQFKDALGRMDNKIELEVVALWSNLDSILKEVGKEEKIKTFKEGITSTPPEKILSAKIELGKAVKSLLDERRDKVGSEIIDELKKWAIDFRNHEVLDDAMIMNTAFLVNKHQEEDFDESVDYLNRKYQEKINFRVIGPLPPYSFSTLKLKRIKFEKIREAARVLNLGEEATLSEVKEAYRDLTRKFHPDKNPPGSTTQKRFKEISEAYHILVDCCSSGKYSLREKKNKDLIVVKILETPKG
jgi:hypothetical protein